MSGQEFENQDLTGAKFHRVRLAGAVFHDVDLAGVTLESANLRGATFRQVNFAGVTLSQAGIDGLTINGFDVSALIEAERDRRDPDGAPLRRFARAVETGEAATVRDLLRANPYLATSTTGGWTPFRTAVRRGHREVVATMLAHGARIDAAEVQHALHHAMQGSPKPEIVELLLGTGKVPPVFAAVYRGDLAGLEGLLAADPRLLEARDAGGHTPLLRAAENGQAEVVELLLARGADLHARGRKGASALFLCAWNEISAPKRVAMLELLLARGAEVDARDDEGRTPLFAAASCNLQDSVAVLLARGAGVTACDRRGWTALRAAVEYGHIAVAELLRRHGAE